MIAVIITSLMSIMDFKISANGVVLCFLKTLKCTKYIN